MSNLHLLPLSNVGGVLCYNNLVLSSRKLDIKKDGFTLVELLAVVIILAIISLFVMPKVADLIKSGNSTNTSIIEQIQMTMIQDFLIDL